ncbi:MAG: hypothetical protein CL681_09075 [Blastopirellula sp.]|nr:hypothetical protein [Blastopirellula sp.]
MFYVKPLIKRSCGSLGSYFSTYFVISITVSFKLGGAATGFASQEIEMFRRVDWGDGEEKPGEVR